MLDNNRAGLIISVACYTIWGLLPLFWKELSHVDPYSILAHRIVWSGLLMFIITFLLKRREFLADCKMLWNHKKKALALGLAAILISINWLTYIWAVSNGHVMDTSLGYYINPLLSVLLGVFVFKEYLIPAKRISIAIAAFGILMLTILYGAFPWVALVLALSFGLYGALKKKLNINPFTAITLETALVAPLALVFLFFVDDFTLAYFNSGMTSTAWLLMASGIATSVPMVLFSYGANMLPLNLLGILQYISPSITFILSILAFNEPFGSAQMIAFVCIWLAIGIFLMSEKMPATKIRTK